MDVVVDQIPQRDLATIRFSDIVAAPYTGYTEGVMEYPEPGSFSYVYVFSFNGNLTQQEQRDVFLRVTTTPEKELVMTRARQALATNNNFLAITTPTNAQVVQQVKALTRECNALIKLFLNDLSDTTGT